MQSAAPLPASSLAPPVSNTPSASAVLPSSDSVCQHTSRGVMLIGLFKLSKAIFFTCLGIAALRMVHHSLGDLVMRVADFLPVDPEGRLVSLLVDKADLIGNHQLREFSVATIGYAVVCLIEGTGLMLQKPWAEYLTVALTTLALPWELFELARRPSWLRVAVLLVNLAVLLYLIWVLKRHKRRFISLEPLNMSSAHEPEPLSPDLR